MSADAYWIKVRAEKYDPHILKRLSVLFLCVLLFSGVFIGAQLVPKKKPVPLLLSTGLTDAREAELRVILWFESGKPSENLRQSLPQIGWEWKESNLNTSDLKSAYSISGFTIIHSTDEEQIYHWFQTLSDRVQGYGGMAYLDERVSEGIDIANYSVQNDIIPVQWALSENSISVTGLMQDTVKSVQAGSDSVNIQLISHSHAGKGRTTLAVPVLLEEF